MPIIFDPGSGSTDPIIETLTQQLGILTPPPPPPTAVATLGRAPTVSSTPNPGQGIALDAAGKIPASVLTRTTRGVAVVSWPGGGSMSSSTTVSHALGTTPTGVMATMLAVTSGVTVICPCQVINITSSTFDVRCQTIDASTPGAGSSVSVFWIASA